MPHRTAPAAPVKADKPEPKSPAQKALERLGLKRFGIILEG